MYSLSGLSVPQPGYSASITSVEYWDGAAPAATGTYTLASHIQSACPASGDKGLAADHDRSDVLGWPSRRDRPDHQEEGLMNVRDEDGQALVLALAFLIFFGLVIGLDARVRRSERTFDSNGSASSDRRSTRRTAPRTRRSSRAEEHDRRCVRRPPLPGGESRRRRRARSCSRRQPPPPMPPSRRSSARGRRTVPTRTDGDVHDVRRGRYVARRAGDRAVPRHPARLRSDVLVLDLLRARARRVETPRPSVVAGHSTATGDTPRDG